MRKAQFVGKLVPYICPLNTHPGGFLMSKSCTGLVSRKKTTNTQQVSSLYIKNKKKTACLAESSVSIDPTVYIKVITSSKANIYKKKCDNIHTISMLISRVVAGSIITHRLSAHKHTKKKKSRHKTKNSNHYTKIMIKYHY